MTINIEKEVEIPFLFDYIALTNTIVETVLEELECPYECSVNLLLTGNQEIHEMNLEYREIDRPTDVLSFPMTEYEIPGDFSDVEDQPDCFEPDSGELMLGDIVISVDKVLEQAKEYGHSVKREFAFLIVHSMLHLTGYDHIQEEDCKIMEEKQSQMMEVLAISRETRE